ncbi:PriCT-2 domain-containing protein [Sphingomonas faeni]|uniref:PriCT-2 domain-containing protein n=1 Tax=Sphingomonas faeni TaxID=185950 RepID=UPI003355B43E
MTDSVMSVMKGQRRWLVANPDKQPFYINGQMRSGTLDSPADTEQLASYDEAKAVQSVRGDGWHLGFALGPDGTGGHWQGIDLDKVVDNRLADLANTAPGYVEMSPSGTGAHAIGYGRHFVALGSNGTGIEAYAAGRYFTVTERLIRDDGPVCLAGHVEQVLAPRHGAGRPASADNAEQLSVDPKTVTELRSALLHMWADDYDVWYRMGLALKELGATGRGLWLDWSATSEKFNAKQAAKKWEGFAPRDTGHRAVFAEAQKKGWVNPASNAAQPDPVAIDLSVPPMITLEFAMSSDTATIKLEYLSDPLLPAKCVVGSYGRGSTAKSSLWASAAAHISSYAATLWVSVEEPADWIKTRHIACGGREQTLAVVKAVASKKDAQERVIASSFNIYEHLEPAIAAASGGFTKANKPPLRLVVLDTAVGLTGWAKNESPNDDAAVKKLLGYLQALAEQYNLTIVAIGHANKGKHEHFADTVMGASAWTNSPRLSFVHASDVREDYSYVVRVAKTNFDTFGMPYQTAPVHTLYERTNGPDTVLVRVVPGNIVWGEAASMEMFMDATKKPREDDEGGGSGGRGQTLPVGVLQALVELVMEQAPGECVTREQVELRLGKPVDRRRWTKVDEHLNLHPTVAIERGEKNRVLYRRRPAVQ